MITVENLNFSYHKSQPIIQDLSFDVPKGSIYGFLGANGSGKTTAIRLLLNLIKPESGSVTINEARIESSYLDLYQTIGTLIEAPTIYGHLTGFENLVLWGRFYGVEKERITEVLAMVGLEYAKDKKTGKYSLGMKQRLGIASSILHDPDVLILDEPLNGLDPKGIAEIRDLFFQFKEEGKTVFISSHLLTEIENTCTDVCIIDEGKKLFSGKIEDLKLQFEKNETYILDCFPVKKAEAVLTKFPGFKTIKVKESFLTFQVPNKEDIPMCLSILLDADIQVFELKKQQNNLENLYLKLTQNA